MTWQGDPRPGGGWEQNKVRNTIQVPMGNDEPGLCGIVGRSKGAGSQSTWPRAWYIVSAQLGGQREPLALGAAGRRGGQGELQGGGEQGQKGRPGAGRCSGADKAGFS